MQDKFVLELYNRQITEFYFKSGLNAFIIEYTKNICDLNEDTYYHKRKKISKSISIMNAKFGYNI